MTSQMDILKKFVEDRKAAEEKFAKEKWNRDEGLKRLIQMFSEWAEALNNGAPGVVSFHKDSDVEGRFNIRKIGQSDEYNGYDIGPVENSGIQITKYKDDEEPVEILAVVDGTSSEWIVVRNNSRTRYTLDQLASDILNEKL